MHRSLSRTALAALALLVLSLPTPPQAGAADPGSILVRAVGERDTTTGDAVPLAGAPFTAYTDATLTTAGNVRLATSANRELSPKAVSSLSPCRAGGFTFDSPSSRSGALAALWQPSEKVSRQRSRALRIP